MGSSAYEAPLVPALLTISTFLYLINVADYLLAHLIQAGLLGPLAVGIVFGPEAADIISEDALQTFIILGYIGLLLLVFEAGLTTEVSAFVRNLLLSTVVALSGVVIPIALSLLLLHVGYGYTLLQAFGAGASLCSTSLGTTLALLRPEMRQSRVGSVLLSAALLDDIVGLVIAGIISNLAKNDAGGISWVIVVRPILVSVAFALGTPLCAHGVKVLVLRLPERGQCTLYLGHAQLFIAVGTISGFVASARYAGTSDIFGAYLSGTFLAHAFPPLSPTVTSGRVHPVKTPHEAFTSYLLPILQFLLSPIFFASIGAALPIRALFTADGSHRVVWRGLVYSLLMILAKAFVGMWMLVWPKSLSGGRPPQDQNTSKRSEKVEEIGDGGLANTENAIMTPDCGCDESRQPGLSSVRSAALLGLAMVTRGEIALIVAQLARPLLMKRTSDGSSGSEAFAVVIWAILLSTVSGALGVGLLLRSWK